jgi:hypothetical protein
MDFDRRSWRRIIRHRADGDKADSAHLFPSIALRFPVQKISSAQRSGILGLPGCQVSNNTTSCLFGLDIAQDIGIMASSSAD